MIVVDGSMPANVGTSADTERTVDETELQLVEQNRKLKEDRTCKVCMDREINTVFLPCGHLVCCESCAKSLSNCPICRGVVRGTVKTFLS